MQDTDPPVKLKVLWDLDSCPVPASLQPAQVVRKLVQLSDSLGALQNIICFSSKMTVPIQKQLQMYNVQLSLSTNFVSDLPILTVSFIYFFLFYFFFFLLSLFSSMF